MVGNGRAQTREVITAAGAVEVSAPRVDDRREGERFTSAILPPYLRRSAKVSEVLPLLYLRGLSTNDFAPALQAFFGSDAGLSASTLQRLTEAWRAERERWAARCTTATTWTSGPTAVTVRLPNPATRRADPLCLLVIVGVRLDGTKELVAVAAGYRESTESWAEVQRDLRDRGMTATTWSCSPWSASSTRPGPTKRAGGGAAVPNRQRLTYRGAMAGERVDFLEAGSSLSAYATRCGSSA